MDKKNIQNDTNSNSPLEDVGELGVLDSSSSMFYEALPIHFELTKKLRDIQTEAERILWVHLPKLEGVRFKRQHPILYFIADFYCHKAN